MKFCPNCGAKLPEGARFCENCGAAVAAAVGAPVPPPVAPAPEVPASSEVPYSAAPPTGYGQPSAGYGQPPTGYGQQPYAGGGAAPAWSGDAAASPASAPRKGRRGLLTSIGGVAAVGVLGVVGYFVYDHFTGPNGGADSPSAAVMELSAAADGEDAVTALSLLPPGEVGPIVGLYQDVQAKAASTGVTPKDNPFAGFDVHVQGVAVKTDQLGPDVAAVTITHGTVSWSLDPDKLQGPLRIDSHGRVRHATKGSADLVEVTKDASNGAPLRLMTVQRDGKWYVSPMYTLLEAWRADQGLPTPDFSKELDLTGTGAKSGSAAVEQAAQALARYDVDGFLDLLSPDEAGALYQYRDAIVTALHKDGSLAQLQSQAQLSVNGVTATEGDAVDGRVPVTVRSANGSFSDDRGHSGSWTLDRDCVSWVSNGDSDGGCLDDVLQNEGVGASIASDLPTLTLLTQKVDGRWYLSPMATVVTDLRQVVAKLDADDVASLLRVPQFGGVDGQLKEGKTVDGSVDHAYGYALYEMDVPAGKVLTACVDGGYGPWIYGPDGRPTDQQAVLAKNGGRYRVLVSSEKVGSFRVTPQLSDVQKLAVPSTVPPAGGDACGYRLFSFDATAGQPVVFTTEDNSDVMVTPPSGDTFYGSVFEPTESGEHFVTVSAEHTVSVAALGADVLRAGSQTTASVSGSQTTTLHVFVEPEQNVEIQVADVGTSVPYIELLTQDGSVVSSDYPSFYSGSATVTADGGSSGQLYDLTIRDVFGESGSYLVNVTGVSHD